MSVHLSVRGSYVSVCFTLVPESCGCAGYTGLISLVTPLATNTWPLPRVTSAGYQRPWFIESAWTQLLVLGRNTRVLRMPSSSMTPLSVPGIDGSE